MSFTPSILNVRRTSGTLAVLLAWIAAACSTGSTSSAVNDAALADESQGANWLAYGRTYREQRHSPLTQISDATISGLGVDWYLDLPDARSLVATPLVVDGVMYFEAGYNVVHAVW